MIATDEIKNDVELRAYFFDFLCRGFVLGLTDLFKVSECDRVRFQKEYYDSLLSLSTRLEQRVGADQVLPTIHEVSTHYLAHVGRIGFEQYEPTEKLREEKK